GPSCPTRKTLGVDVTTHAPATWQPPELAGERPTGWGAFGSEIIMSYILGYRLAGRQAAWNCCDGGPFPRERNLLPRDLNVPLPESSEINRSSALHCERRDGVNLITIRHATV